MEVQEGGGQKRLINAFNVSHHNTWFNIEDNEDVEESDSEAGFISSNSDNEERGRPPTPTEIRQKRFEPFFA